MKFSLVDLAPVTPGRGKQDALDLAVTAAQDAERHGYHRIWYAEHHHATGYASQDPVPLIAIASQTTSTIRIGSGAVLLNHHSAYTVAERFLMLEGLAPGRIDLGLGRASGTPLIDQVLRRDRGSRPRDDFAEQVREVLGYYHRDFDPHSPLATIDLTQGIDGVPEVWVLGSSGSSAGLAGRLGLGYVFGAHINAPLAEVSLARYREGFAMTRFGAGAPQSVLALNVVAADDEDLAHRLTWPARAMRAGGRERPIPTLDQATRELGATAKEAPSAVRGGVIPAQISGTPATLREQLEPLVRALGVTEVVVQDMLTDVELRERSRELVAEALSSIEAGDQAATGVR